MQKLWKQNPLCAPTTMAVLRSYLKLGGTKQPLSAGQEFQQNRLCDRLLWDGEAALSYVRTTGSFIRGLFPHLSVALVSAEPLTDCWLGDSKWLGLSQDIMAGLQGQNSLREPGRSYSASVTPSWQVYRLTSTSPVKNTWPHLVVKVKEKQYHSMKSDRLPEEHAGQVGCGRFKKIKHNTICINYKHIKITKVLELGLWKTLYLKKIGTVLSMIFFSQWVEIY